MKKIETRDVQLFAAADKLELRAGDGDAPSVIVGYAAVFNSDSEDLGGFVERLLPGSFADSLTDGSDIRALVGHDDAKLLGRSSSGTLRLAEDERGLRVEIDLPNVSYANDLRELIRRRDLVGMSFGFSVRDGGERFTKENGQTVRELSKVKLFEVSVVAVPAYNATDVQLRHLHIDPAAVAEVRSLQSEPSSALAAARRRLHLVMAN